MKMMQTLVQFGNERHSVDTIEYEGQFWLVPQWIDHLDEGTTQPLRIIPLAKLQHQELKYHRRYRFAVNKPIPKTLLGVAPVPNEIEQRYGVVRRPPIYVPAEGEPD